MSDECKYIKPEPRYVLYFMVFWIFLDCNSCGIMNKVKTIEKQLTSIQASMELIKLEHEIILNKDKPITHIP